MSVKDLNANMESVAGSSVSPMPVMHGWRVIIVNYTSASGTDRRKAFVVDVSRDACRHNSFAARFRLAWEDAVMFADDHQREHRDSILAHAGQTTFTIS
jgi:hypothetical protein